MRPILVTGANKGIGKAIARAALRAHDDTRVFLGSRDRRRGDAAVSEILASDPHASGRVHLVEIDVADDASVRAAASRVRELLAGSPLYALVNNAGIGLGQADLRQVIEVNTLGVRRVTEAFLPLLDPAAGRIVNITSGSGPSYVATCRPDRQVALRGRGLTMADVDRLIDEVLGLDGADAFEAAGLGNGDPYGVSKALANTYTAVLAAQHPNLVIHACTPGFIETDLTRPYAEAQGVAPAELGMRSPEEATVAPLKLLFDDVPGRGWYFGSDGQRSPMHVYRSPGSPPYQGDD